MTTETITIPRLENEHPTRYQARVEYMLMGGQRSIEAVRKKIGNRSARRLEEWSREDNWVSLAADYDQTLYTLAAQADAQQYQADLADYRRRYGDMGKGLWQAAAVLTRRLTKEAATMELGPGTLTLVANAAKTAADLEALALRIESLLNESGSE